MATSAIQSNLQSPHLITPIVRCPCTASPRDTLANQIAPFSDFLKSNRIDRPGDTFKLSKIHEQPPSPEQPKSQPPSTPLLPNLAEIIPVQPRPKLAGLETRLHQQLTPATNHALDIYA